MDEAKQIRTEAKRFGINLLLCIAVGIIARFPIELGNWGHVAIYGLVIFGAYVLVIQLKKTPQSPDSSNIASTAEPLVSMPVTKTIQVKFTKPTALEFTSIEDEQGFIE